MANLLLPKCVPDHEGLDTVLCLPQSLTTRGGAKQHILLPPLAAPSPPARPLSLATCHKHFACTTGEGSGGSAPSCALATPRMAAATDTRIGHVGQLPRATAAAACAPPSPFPKMNLAFRAARR